MKTHRFALAPLAAAALLSGCSALAPAPDYDKLAAQMMAGSFSDRGIAKVDRLKQDASNAECSKAAGAAASFLSGGGSTVGAFVQEGEEKVALAMAEAAEASGYNGRSIITAPTSKGAEVVETAG